jgi:hypothetical protein
VPLAAKAPSFFCAAGISTCFQVLPSVVWMAGKRPVALIASPMVMPRFGVQNEKQS